jgi:NAD-dependent deacetylase
MTSQTKRQTITELEPLVVLTGAGISAESGIPTFRGDGGIWKSYRPEDLATPEAFKRDPSLVWEFYHWRRKLIAASSPNPGHLTLAQMENELNDFTLITQNVDGLHQQAGSKNVIEIHGSIWDIVCTGCDKMCSDQQVTEDTGVPICQICGEMTRPDVVWFGEMLDADILKEAADLASEAKTMMVIGTSALVQPANALPILAKRNGAELIEINPDVTPLSAIVDIRFSRPSGEVLPRWWREVKENSLDSNQHMPFIP